MLFIGTFFNDGTEKYYIKDKDGNEQEIPLDGKVENRDNVGYYEFKEVGENKIIVYRNYGDSTIYEIDLFTNKLVSKYSVEGEYIEDIEYGKRKLTVRGIHKGEKNLVVMQSLMSDRNEENYFDGISMINNRKAVTFAKNNGYENTSISNSVYYSISNAIVSIFSLVIFFLTLIMIIKEMITFKEKPIIKILYVVFALIFLKLFLIISKVKVGIPVELLPNQWSDFDYWSEFYKQYSEKFRYIIYMKKYTFDRVYIDNIIGATFFIIITLILFIIIRRYFKIDTWKKVLVATMILLVFSFLNIVIVSNKYNVNVNNLELWFIVPYYLFSNYIIKNISYSINKFIE